MLFPVFVHSSSSSPQAGDTAPRYQAYVRSPDGYMTVTDHYSNFLYDTRRQTGVLVDFGLAEVGSTIMILLCLADCLTERGYGQLLLLV